MSTAPSPAARRRSQSYFNAKRAEALAVLKLTRRDDLLVSDEHAVRQLGIDLAVTVREGGGDSARMFGVEVEGTLDDRLFEEPGRHDGRLKFGNDWLDLTFPTVLFLFHAAADAGKYRWLLRPVVDADGRADLAADGNDWADLDDDAVADVVADVTRWYDARRARRSAA